MGTTSVLNVNLSMINPTGNARLKRVSPSERRNKTETQSQTPIRSTPFTIAMHWKMTPEKTAEGHRVVTEGL